jgi:hypothetical protein
MDILKKHPAPWRVAKRGEVINDAFGTLVVHDNCIVDANNNGVTAGFHRTTNMQLIVDCMNTSAETWPNPAVCPHCFHVSPVNEDVDTASGRDLDAIAGERLRAGRTDADFRLVVQRLKS